MQGKHTAEHHHYPENATAVDFTWIFYISYQFLEVLKDKMDGALGYLVLWKLSPPRAGRVELDDLLGPSPFRYL